GVSPHAPGPGYGAGPAYAAGSPYGPESSYDAGPVYDAVRSRGAAESAAEVPRPPADPPSLPEQRRARGGIGWGKRRSGRESDRMPDQPTRTAAGPLGNTGAHGGRSLPEAAPPDAASDRGARASRGAHVTGGPGGSRWPDPAELLLTALDEGERRWERGPSHVDALTVRIGTARYGSRPSVPVTVDLREARSLGLAGPRPRLLPLARAVLAQLALLHPPSALEIVVLASGRGRSVEDWSWLGWLPHLRPGQGQDCRLLLAFDRDQAAARTEELLRRLEDGPLGSGWVTAEEAEIRSAAAAHSGPSTVLVVDGDPGTAELRESVARLAGSGAAGGVHVICLAETPPTTATSPLADTLSAAYSTFPAFRGCGALALLSGAVATAVRVVRRGDSPAGELATVDGVSAAWAERFARALAPAREAVPAAAGDHRRPAAALPPAARLLDELGLARATPAALLARWASTADGAGGASSVSLVLGAGRRGAVTTDLAQDRSHLFVSGGAGSGKTELLCSLSASLAAGERPDRLGLVLVDGAGEGLRPCAELPHVMTYLGAGDPVRMREFARSLSAELKRRGELLSGMGYEAYVQQSAGGSSAEALAGPQGSRSTGGSTGDGDRGTLRLRAGRRAAVPPGGATAALPRLAVLVDDFDALVDPALGNPGRPAAGSVVRALEAVARDGVRLGIHLIAATGRPDRTAQTVTDQSAALRASIGGDPSTDEHRPGRGVLHRPDGEVATFQGARVTGRIPRTATTRPTVVPLDWAREGDPPSRRPVRELGNGPTDLALLASAVERAAREAGATPPPPLVAAD
ncbi:cell division protein FtsK, partial [Streptomyces sp. XM4193]|uniref:FtsK/SpoIIIE domain-containing protein n=1 Tax=Streptomyces sp. XM4193 TaxID=2929782 RepID=UPI001FF77757